MGRGRGGGRGRPKASSACLTGQGASGLTAHCCTLRVIIHSGPHLAFSSLWTRHTRARENRLVSLVCTRTLAHAPCPRRLEGLDTQDHSSPTPTLPQPLPPRGKETAVLGTLLQHRAPPHLPRMDQLQRQGDRHDGGQGLDLPQGQDQAHLERAGTHLPGPTPALPGPPLPSLLLLLRPAFL